MNKETPIEFSHTCSVNDISDYRDLQLSLAVRTLLHKSFGDVDLDTVLDVLQRETDHLRYQILTASPMQMGQEIKDESYEHKPTTGIGGEW